MEAIQEADPCLTKPLFRDIGGPICKGKHKNNTIEGVKYNFIEINC